MSPPKVSGLNHLTLAVSDLERALRFYRDLLGFRLKAQWAEGAYLEAGALWLCLSVDASRRVPSESDYTHIAFDVSADDFASLASQVSAHAPIWKENRSEGHSLYFLDPDGHRLELHVGSLESRLAYYQNNPSKGVAVMP